MHGLLPFLSLPQIHKLQQQHMISLLIFALFSTALSFDFPTFKTSVTWPTSNSKNITTNLPFQVSAVFQFPSWATTKTMHPLTVDNPGPRTDSYLVQLSLVNPADSEHPLRMIFQQELAAFNGEWSANADFILPSYLIEMGKEEQEFAFSIKLSNLDQINSLRVQEFSGSGPITMFLKQELGLDYLSMPLNSSNNATLKQDPGGVLRIPYGIDEMICLAGEAIAGNSCAYNKSPNPSCLVKHHFEGSWKTKKTLLQKIKAFLYL